MPEPGQKIPYDKDGGQFLAGEDPLVQANMKLAIRVQHAKTAGASEGYILAYGLQTS